ncbi:RNA-guided pseudouridylation complex pseudouridine synthase subunit Cbf5 [Candidatus Pacearchaeota archaeon]|nr:RNA-guided pseudouridylation complex pseudouridine synthase subunit Cbf5 [Candidatus Pacearchaeota archaeon]
MKKKNKSIQELLKFGIINIDKPSGPTSFNVSDFVRKTLGLRKTSHFGTLDPKVTGVLPIALNRGCKLTGYFLGEDKEYVGIMRIHGDVPLDKIKKMIKKKFVGKIRQTPPVKSRVKRQEREREVMKFKLLEKDGKDILFHVECQGGTYIRKLCDDLGRELGVGAHMLELRRVRAGIFKEDKSVNLYEFERAAERYKKSKIFNSNISTQSDVRKAVKAYKDGDDKLLKKIIIPGEIVSELHPIVEIKEDNLDKILVGKPIHPDDLVKKSKIEAEEIVTVFCGERFVGMYKILNDKYVWAKPEFVMQEIRG